MLHYTDAQFKGRERAVTTWWSRAGRMELVIPHPERLLRVDRHTSRRWSRRTGAVVRVKQHQSRPSAGLRPAGSGHLRAPACGWPNHL